MIEDRPDYAASRAWQGTTAVPENMADRPDYHGSLNPSGSQTFAPTKPYDFSNPAEQIRKGATPTVDVSQQFLEAVQRSKVPPAIKVFTVCVKPGVGEHMAFLGSDPTKRVTAGSREAAVATLLADQKLIVMTEID